MSVEDRMSIDERRKYLRRMQKRCRKASREEKSELLDEMGAVTELHRKSLIRLMRGDLARKPRRRQREATYGAEVRAAVRVIAESLDWVCAERLQPAMRLRKKTVLPADDGRPARIRRRFDAAQTPFDRLAATGILAPEQQAHLQAFRDATNPRQLRQRIYDLLCRLFALPLASPGSA